MVFGLDLIVCSILGSNLFMRSAGLISGVLTGVEYVSSLLIISME